MPRVRLSQSSMSTRSAPLGSWIRHTAGCCRASSSNGRTPALRGPSGTGVRRSGLGLGPESHMVVSVQNGDRGCCERHAARGVRPRAVRGRAGAVHGPGGGTASSGEPRGERDADPVPCAILWAVSLTRDARSQPPAALSVRGRLLTPKERREILEYEVKNGRARRLAAKALSQHGRRRSLMCAPAGSHAWERDGHARSLPRPPRAQPHILPERRTGRG